MAFITLTKHLNKVTTLSFSELDMINELEMPGPTLCTFSAQAGKLKAL